jgi:FSR family fosmidomycin resistance protein-like MFS transporter
MGYLAATAVFAVLLVVTDAVVAAVIGGVLGIALNIPVPVHTTFGQAYYLPRYLGLASAVTLGLAVSTGGLASPVLGLLADHHGITTTLAALLALAAALTLPLRARRNTR